ncbi:MAG: hypothetical protein AAFN77_16120 [Planctomycetota bacterium]
MNKFKPFRLARGRRRDGMVALLMAITCIVLISVLLLLASQISMNQRQRLRLETQVEQTEWLRRAGVDLAEARSANLPIQNDKMVIEISGYDQSELQINTTESESKPNSSVLVTATITQDGLVQTKTKRSKEINP